MKSLPEVHEGDVLDGVSASVTEHFTTPPKQYTEDTLLSAMETAGNDQFDDDTEKKGLGTPATRAGIIEKLVKSGFAERKGKSLIPTKDGCNLVCVLPEQITSPAMTAEWENTLMEIERGNADADAFLSGIVQMTGDLVKAYPFLSDAEAQRFGTGKEEIGKCPRCGSPVYIGKGNFYCSNKDCSFCLWEDNKFFSSKKKKLTKKIAKELLDKGWCRVTGLYTPKKPQLYDAVIRLDDSGGKYVSFKMDRSRTQAAKSRNIGTSSMTDSSPSAKRSWASSLPFSMRTRPTMRCSIMPSPADRTRARFAALHGLVCVQSIVTAKSRQSASTMPHSHRTL